jgi:tetratricopeptide (TPR) repeat protein
MGRLKEADASERQSVAILEQLVREDPTVADYQRALAGSFSTLSSMLAAQSLWQDSATMFQRAIELDKNDHHTVFSLAMVALTAGDMANYRAACAELLSRFGEKPQGFEAFNIGLACVAGERAVDDPEAVVTIARRALTAEESLNPARHVVLGAAQYRAGHLEEAEKTLRAASPLHAVAQAAAPSFAAPIRCSHAMCEYFLACCYRDRGEQEKLRAQIAKIEALVQSLKKMPVRAAPATEVWMIPFTIEMGQREVAELKAGLAPKAE